MIDSFGVLYHQFKTIGWIVGVLHTDKMDKILCRVYLIEVCTHDGWASDESDELFFLIGVLFSPS